MPADGESPQNPETPEHRYGVRFFDVELNYLDTIQVEPGQSLDSYAQVIITEQCKWTRGPLRSKAFVKVVGQEFQELFAKSSPDEIQRARDTLVTYGNQLHASRDWGDYLSWALKVRRLANFTRPQKGESPTAVQYISEDETDIPSVSSERFWQDVYLNSSYRKQASTAMDIYVFGPDVEQKDPSVLLDIIERLQNEPTEEVFANSTLVNNDPTRIVRIAYDNLQLLLREAHAAGWTNAAAIQALINEARSKGVPQHVMIIHAGNRVAEILGKQSITSPKVQPGKRSVHDLNNLPEAVNRCLFLALDLGPQPAGHDPLNYFLTGQIIGALGPLANSHLRKD